MYCSSSTLNCSGSEIFFFSVFTLVFCLPAVSILSATGLYYNLFEFEGGKLQIVDSTKGVILGYINVHQAGLLKAVLLPDTNKYPL